MVAAWHLVYSMLESKRLHAGQKHRLSDVFFLVIHLFFTFVSVALGCHGSEIDARSAQNPGLSNALCLKPAAGQNTVVCCACCQEFCL